MKGKEGKTNEGGRKGREGEGEKMREKKRERSRGRQLHTADARHPMYRSPARHKLYTREE